MSLIKRIIRKIIREKKEPPHYLQYIENNGSILRPSFSARLDKPAAGKKYIHLGKGSILSCNIVFESSEGSVNIGNECVIENSTFISRDNITIEDHVLMGWGCTICDHSFHSLDYRDRRDDYKNMYEDAKNNRGLNVSKNWDSVDSKPVRICTDAWIGMNCLIMQGITIGKGAIVGANSVVRKNVPDYTIVAGNPAEVIAKLPVPKTKIKKEENESI